MPWFPRLAFDVDDWLKDPLTNKVQLKHQVTTVANIKYYEDEICRLDVYLPEGFEKEKVPTIMNIHGGGWITGDKYKRRGQGYLYADSGICLVNINYGLSPQYKYHEVVKHCYMAMKWINDNADKYNFDLSNLFITGDSAGAQLACLMLATQSNPQFKKELEIPEFPARFKSGILSCGPYDADATVENPLSSIFIGDMTGKKRKEVQTYQYYDAFRTLDWIDENFPDDVLINYGRFDFIVGRQETSLINKLDKLGKRHYDYRAKGLGDHCYHLYYRRKESQIFYKIVDEYFTQMLDPNRENLKDKTLKLSIPDDSEWKIKDEMKAAKREEKAAKKLLKFKNQQRKYAIKMEEKAKKNAWKNGDLYIQDLSKKEDENK